MAVSVVLFGTLLEADAPANPVTALREVVDCTVTGISAGWRKLDPRSFETVARRPDVPVADLVHVGTDPETDRAVEAAGARFLDASGRPLATVAADREVAP